MNAVSEAVWAHLQAMYAGRLEACADAAITRQLCDETPAQVAVVGWMRHVADQGLPPKTERSALQVRLAHAAVQDVDWQGLAQRAVTEARSRRAADPAKRSEDSEILAKRDVVHVRLLLAQGLQGCVVNGDHLSPSWRALPGGAEVWERKLDGEAYEDTLDRELDALAERLGKVIYWEDGALWAM